MRALVAARLPATKTLRPACRLKSNRAERDEPDFPDIIQMIEAK
jgi:hypothetical protein